MYTWSQICWGLLVLGSESAGIVLQGGRFRRSGNESTGVSSSLSADLQSFAAPDQDVSQECSFELYDPLSDMLRIVDPARISMVFHQGAVYVVDGETMQDGTYQRYLTFNQATAAIDGGSAGASAFNNFFAGGSAVQQLTRPRCREQVQVTCKATTGEKSTGGCEANVCQPNVRENMVPEYRALLGSALSGCNHLGRAAVLGFGAGIVPAALAQSHPEALVESVDISGGVLAAARCFGLEASDQMTLIEADGRAYLVGLDDGVLDMLFVDIYDDKANIPPCFTTAEFFATAKRKLSKQGLLAMNLVTHEINNVLLAVLASFSNVKLGKLSNDHGNNVLLASTDGVSPVRANEDASANSFSSLFATWAQEGAFQKVSQSSAMTRTDAEYCT